MKAFPVDKLLVLTKLLNKAFAWDSLVSANIWFSLTPPIMPAPLAIFTWPPIISTFPADITLPLMVTGAPPLAEVLVAAFKVSVVCLFFKTS